jgi:hypothetical protein
VKHLGDYITLAIVVGAIWFARRKGKQSAAAALANAHAHGYAEGKAAALASAVASNTVAVHVGNNGQSGHDDDIPIHYRATSNDLDTDHDVRWVRALRDRNDTHPDRMGELPAGSEPRPDEGRELPGALAARSARDRFVRAARPERKVN